MAKFALTDAFVLVNAVDLSDHVKQVTVNYSAEVLEKTAMGETSKTRISGLKDWSLEIEFYQDFAAGEVDATLFSLVGGAAVAIEVRPTSAAVGPTNPKFTGNGIVESYNPLGNSVGEVAMAPVTILGDGTLTRATA